jgi:TPR repeat protein
VKWYRKAAEQGYAAAQSNLGAAYYHGQGVRRDYSLSYFWYSLSVSRSTGENYTKRAQYRDATAKKLDPGRLMKAQQMAKEWEAKHPKE